MRLGIFRDRHPRLRLLLPGRQEDYSVEAIVDTGFEGDLALPQPVIFALDAALSGIDSFALADGSRLNCRVYEFLLDWNDEQRPVEVLMLDGAPLIGTHLMEGFSLQVEMSEGGEVQLDPL